MYLAAWHRCWREVKYRCHLRSPARRSVRAAAEFGARAVTFGLVGLLGAKARKGGPHDRPDCPTEVICRDQTGYSGGPLCSPGSLWRGPLNGCLASRNLHAFPLNLWLGDRDGTLTAGRPHLAALAGPRHRPVME